MGEWLVFCFCWLTFDPATIRGQSLTSLALCLTGPGHASELCGCIGRFDWDGDCDIDLYDVAIIEACIGSGEPITEVGR